MACDVRVYESLRECAGGAVRVVAEGATVRELVDDLARRYPGMGERLLDDSGLRRGYTVFVNADDVRHGQGLDTPLTGGETVRIMRSG